MSNQIKRMINNTEEPSSSSNENSPEAAGLARGTARTAASTIGKVSQRISTSYNAYEAAANSVSTTFGKRVIIGRIPKGSSTGVAASRVSTSVTTTATTTANKIIPKRLPKRIKLQRVAKASDRLSTGFDLYEAATAAAVDAPIEGNKKHKVKIQGLKDRIITIFNFSGTLVKNTILGAAVFGSYEKLITYVDNNNTLSNNNTINSIDGTNKDENKVSIPCLLKNDAFANVSIMQHFGIGACAGSIHGLVSIVFDSTTYLYNQRRDLYLSFWKSNHYNHHHRRRHHHYHQQNHSSNVKSQIKTKFNQSIPWGINYTIHHSIAHAVLFASYEGAKRFIHSSFAKEPSLLLSPLSDDDNDDDDDDKGLIIPSSTKSLVSTWLNSDVLTIVMAGGIAGQSQHFISHITEQILNVSDDHTHHHHHPQIISTRPNPMKSMTTTLSWMKNLKLPTLNSMIVAFFPSAVGFAAFEFGKDLVS